MGTCKNLEKYSAQNADFQFDGADKCKYDLLSSSSC